MKLSKAVLMAGASALIMGATAPVFAADDASQKPTTIKPMAPEAAPDSTGTMEKAPGGAAGGAIEATPDTRAMGNDSLGGIGADWVAAQNIPSDKLVGADVVNANNEEIGEVEKLVTVAGKDKLIVSVGEFLGIGGHTVALDLEQIRVFHHRGDMDDIRILTDMTEDQLKAQPAYEEPKN